MKIAIHPVKDSFSEYWIKYCDENAIEYKLVNSYDTNIISTLKDCDIFMWHFQHVNPKDVLFAKQLLYSLQQSGKIVYPDWRTVWSFDDKLGQKYQLEAFNQPLIKSYAFYSKSDALRWAKDYKFPAVFKLRGGAGSYNVKLVSSKEKASKLIRKAFGRGFRKFSAITDIKETFSYYIKRKATIKDIIKAFAHIFYPYQIEKSLGNEKGYIYFQEFIPGCDSDIRVQVVDDKCYAMRRFVRKNDFRASGGGNIDFDGSKLPKKVIEMSFDITNKLGAQSLAIDWLTYGDKFLIAEISYGWGIAEGELEYGYWDDNFNYHNNVVDLGEWIIEALIKSVKITDTTN